MLKFALFSYYHNVLPDNSLLFCESLLPRNSLWVQDACYRANLSLRAFFYIFNIADRLSRVSQVKNFYKSNIDIKSLLLTFLVLIKNKAI